MANFIVVNSPTSVAIAGGCRALQYGDGLFTTMRVEYGRIALWPLHLARLQFSARRLGFASLPWDRLTDWLQEQAFNRKNEAQAVLKLLLSRGIGGRGYGPDPDNEVQCYLYHAAMPDYRQWQQDGVQVQLADLRLAQQPALAGLKHCNRLEQVLLKQELAQTDADELIVADSSDHIIEATASNLFYHLQGQWFTPPLTHSGVAGVMRQFILQQLPTIQQRPLPLVELAKVEALFLTNALLGIAPVRQLDERLLAVELVQEIIKQI